MLTRTQKARFRKLARTLRRLRHEEHYDQEEIATKTDCCTACCIAGFAVVQAGYRLDFNPGEWDGMCRKGKNGKRQEILNVAGELLNASHGSHLSFDLFSGSPEYDWPEPYAGQWWAGKKRRSRIAADLLDAIADGHVQ